MSRALLCALIFLAMVPLSAQTTPPDFTGSIVFPLDGPGIRYTSDPATDPVAKLQHDLETGARKLVPNPKTGYLNAVLDALGIPVSSQTLVFSKTSFQMNRIHPGNPRAIYFNDDVYIGYVPGGDVLELSAADPIKGGIFYSIDQPKDGQSQPHIARRDDCLQCHAAPRTLGIPGHIVRSVYPFQDGFAATNAPSYNTDHRSPFHLRFGGWYITGQTGEAKHMGNALAEDPDQPERLNFAVNRNWNTLEGHGVDTSLFLSPHSDVVAHLVLSHQVTAHNYIARAHYEAAQALAIQQDLNKSLNAPAGEISASTSRRLDRAAEALLRYLLFTTEKKLPEPVQGSSDFTRVFAARGPKDKKGHSLRDFDLTTRLFRYPLSFLIYSEAFDALPAPLRSRFGQQLGAALRSGEGAAAGLSLAQRQAIREILIDTKPALRPYLEGAIASFATLQQ